MKRTTVRTAAAFAAAAALAAILAAGALAAAPTLTAMPTITGPAVPFVGNALSATTGTWTGNPTSFAFQWERCDPLGDRVNCVAIAGATSKSYTLTSSDVGHTLAVRVTATNPDGSATKDSKGTAIVSGAVAPKLYVKPTMSGTPTVGSQLTATPGTWAGATSLEFQWQSCDSVGNGCTDISGATNRTYTVRSSDMGRTIRVRVTASNKYGTTGFVTDHGATVTSGIPAQTETQTSVVTTTVAQPNPPAVRLVSLNVLHDRVYVRFRVCSNSSRVTIIEHDLMPTQLMFARSFVVHPSGCTLFARNWLLIPRFRAPHHRFEVTLRGVDSAHRLSQLAARTIVLR